jgi:phosphatidate cytidylyltransferase
MDMSVAAGDSGSGAKAEPLGSGAKAEPLGSGAKAEPLGSGAKAEPLGSGADAEPSGSGPVAGIQAVIKVSRAGRDLRAAIAVGVVLGAAIIASLLTVRHIFIGMTAIAIAVGTWELAGALRRGARINVTLAPLLVGGQAMVWLAWPFGRQGLIVAFVITVLVCLVWRFRGGVTGYVRDVTASFFVAAYVPLFAGFATLLATPADGAGRVAAFMLAVVCSDVGGYAAGVFLGKHPMAPTISPKKSWEGFAGSLLAGTIGTTVTVLLALDGQWWHGALLGAAVVLTATGGDLVESMIKRDLGIKDMGSLLPGHGGLMDRLDSLLPSAVVSWLLLSLLVPV